MSVNTFLLLEEWLGPGGPPSLGSLRRKWRGTSLELSSSPPSERPRERRRISSLQFFPTASATVADPHRHLRIRRVDEVDALPLAVPPLRAKSWLCSHLFSCATSSKNSRCHSRGMGATLPQKPDFSRPQKGPISWPSARHPMVGHHWNHQGEF